jgi:hypothetical protein
VSPTLTRTIESALIRVIALECEIAVEEGEIPEVLRISKVRETLCVADQHEISRSFGGVRVTGAQADARVIVIDCDAIALCSGGRREKRSSEHEQIPKVKKAVSGGRTQDGRSGCH